MNASTLHDWESDGAEKDRETRVQVLDALLRREQELRLSAAAQQAVASPFVGSVTVTPPRSSVP